MLIISVLSEQSNGSLCIIGIQLWHIKVINVINHLQLSFWSKLFTSFLFKRIFKHVLEISGIGVEIEINLGKGIILGEFCGQIIQNTVG